LKYNGFSSCREKKDTEVQILETSKDVESESISELEEKNRELREKIASLKNHYTKVLEFAKKNSIELKPRNVPGVNVNN
jgi:cell division protein FtsL